MSKQITATRVSGDLYDVTYSDSIMCDRMPWRSIERVAREGGYRRILVDQRSYRGEGEPATQIFEVQS